MSHFSFSLSHILTVFLSNFSDYTSQAEALCILCFALSRTHTKMAKWLSILLQLFTRLNDPCLLLLSCLSSFNVLDMHCINFALNQKLILWGLRRQAHKRALTRVASKWDGPIKCHAPNNLPLQPTTKEIFNLTLQLEFMPANPTQSFSFSLDTTLGNMSVVFSFV